jgi:hypothetical protein
VPSGAIAGLAVLGVVALLSIGWALWENRARRRQGRNPSNSGSRQVYYREASQIPPGAKSGGGNYECRHEAEGRMLPAEMDARNKNMVAEM